MSDENQLTPLMMAGISMWLDCLETVIFPDSCFSSTASRGLSTCVELLLAEAGDYERGAAMANLRFDFEHSKILENRCQSSSFL